MNEPPLISIITPVYNVERYLPQCIESIIAQTFQNWELILVNDGSKDRSGVICDEYAVKDSRIRVLHKNNTGQADSRNIALSIANANLIGFVDSDDWIEPDMYELLYQMMIEQQADIAVCGYFRDYKDEVIASCSEGDILVFDKDEALLLILEDNVIKSFPCDKLFRKELITPLFPKSYYYEDYSTIFKWFANSSRVVYARFPRYHYRQRKSSTSNDGDPKKDYHFFVAELERYNYLLMHSILPGDKTVFAQKVLNVGLKQAKNIAKYSLHYKDGIKYIKKINSELKKIALVNYGKLKLHKKMKRLKLLYVPIIFYYEIRLKCKFGFVRKHEHSFYS